MKWIERWHGARVHARRVRVLVGAAAQLLPKSASVLDVGCGDGRLARLLAEARPDLTIIGVEILPREDCAIPVTQFDGRRLPFPDRSFDVAMMIDVLHHTDDPAVLLNEAARVARNAVLLKDHFRNGIAAQATLRFMDIVGNRRYGVPLPFNYLSRAEWERLYDRCALVLETSDRLARLYPWPGSLVFGRGLHFMARLGIRGT